MFGDVIAGRNLRFTARQLIPLPCRPQIDLLILDRFCGSLGFISGTPLLLLRVILTGQSGDNNVGHLLLISPCAFSLHNSFK